MVMKLYPDLPRARRGYILADFGILVWIALCVCAGVLVYNAVMELAGIGHDAISGGRDVRTAIGQMQQLAASLPLNIGPALRDSLTPLYGIPRHLIASGQHEIAAVQHLATLLGAVAGAIPLLAALLLYIPWRIRKTRDFLALERLLRRRGTTSASTTVHVLAARALYTLPYSRLLRYTPDPIAEWHTGKDENLARAALAADGVALDRYLRRAEGTASRPAPRHFKADGDAPR